MESSEGLALRIVRALQGAGHTAYFAGGCVRDRLMGRVPADFDVATSAKPEEVLRIFPRSQKVGAAFGVVLVREQRETVEVATFRADGTYTDGRRPDSVRFTNAEEDARRRDFTCNGLFFDPVAERLFDFVGGVADIEGKQLRAIGEAGKRFGEDYLRILRAVRFSVKLGFTIEGATGAAMREHRGGIEMLSRERVGEELRMIFAVGRAVEAARELAEYGMLEVIFPAYAGQSKGGGEWRRLGKLGTGLSWIVALQVMLRDWLEGVEVDWMKMTGRLRERLILSNEETGEFGWMAEKLPVLRSWRTNGRAVMKRVMADGRWGSLVGLYEACEGENAEMRARVEVLRKEGVGIEPWVTGEDLIGLGARPGPGFRKWLDGLYDRQLEMEFLSREEALGAARVLVGKGTLQKG